MRAVHRTVRANCGSSLAALGLTIQHKRLHSPSSSKQWPLELPTHPLPRRPVHLRNAGHRPSRRQEASQGAHVCLLPPLLCHQRQTSAMRSPKKRINENQSLGAQWPSARRWRKGIRHITVLLIAHIASPNKCLSKHGGPVFPTFPRRAYMSQHTSPYVAMYALLAAGTLLRPA